MSGLEVVGIVLGSIPLVVSALEAYIKFMKDWRKAPMELESLYKRLKNEGTRLDNVCNLLISDVVPLQDIEPMLLDKFGPLWQAKEINGKIRQRLWNSYSSFETTISEVGEALNDIMQRLRVQVFPDGHAEWVNRGRVTREFKKLLYRMHRNDYKDSLETISRNIGYLEGYAQGSITSKPQRKQQARGKLYKVLRDHSTSIYRALCSSILCTDSHHVSLELAPQSIEVGYDTEEDEVLRDARFKVAISFEMVEGSATKRFWDEVNIKTATSSTATPPKQSPGEIQRKSTKRVSFGFKQTVSFMGPDKSPHDIKSAMAILSRPATNIAFIKTCQEEDGQVAQAPLNLCAALRMGRKARPVCYGRLIDTERIDRHFQVYPLGTISNSDDWSIVTLDDVLGGNKGLRPLYKPVEKLQLALAIASSVLQLSKTPWLPEVLTRRNVHFFSRDNSYSYTDPFLLRTFPANPLKFLKATPTTSRPGSMSLSNPTLFALGILLLEIILGEPFEQLRSSDEKVIEGDDDGIIRDSIAAHKLLEEKVALKNPVYQAVVQRCIDCTESNGLDEDNFRQEVYNDVVMQLEAILDYIKIGSRG
ncbi:hypothetical protein FSARC_6536 [Fusarium sarcochroum]|uniref:DUF7580 domain-containing protein n=1 Tax=Fusarium sarcochroum TaxID=1208366 RepID=A0A8H4TX99_9HYPO|nr:hypothetical protein FSARC_6536 [Fusarium sarcochroum]